MGYYELYEWVSILIMKFMGNDASMGGGVDKIESSFVVGVPFIQFRGRGVSWFKGLDCRGRVK